jgi:hypothetical protein
VYGCLVWQLQHVILIGTAHEIAAARSPVGSTLQRKQLKSELDTTKWPPLHICMLIKASRNPQAACRLHFGTSHIPTIYKPFNVAEREILGKWRT